jgi:hypothetical protein
VNVDEKMESHHRRLVPPPLLRTEHPDDELLEDCVDNHDYPSTPGTMKTASTLESTRSRESVLVQVGQPFDEPPSEDDEDQVMEEKKDELEPITTAATAAPSLLTPPSSNNNNNDDARSILMLMSTFGRSQLMHQERAMMLFENMGIPYKCMDGSAPDRKDERNALFQLSGLRGIYPQFFLVQGDDGNNNDNLRCLGDYDAIEGINEASTLPNDVLQDNPTILTWDRLMGKPKNERVAAIKLAKDDSCRI